MAQRPRIMVVEDDEPVRSALDAALRAEGYEVCALPDGRNLAGVTAQFRPDLAILDVRLPEGPDGYAMSRLLRAAGDQPVLFLTAADAVEDRLAGFEAGADDYVAKPFSMSEILARVRALLRRSGRLESAVLQLDDLVIDEGARTAVRNGAAVDLTRIEFDLLLTLANHRGQVLSKSQLLAQVWDFDAYDPNLIEVHISALRRKLEAHGARLIHTVRGVGYVLRA